MSSDTMAAECIPVPATSLPPFFGHMHILAHTSRVQLTVGGPPTIAQDGAASGVVTVRNPFSYPIDVSLQLQAFEVPGVSAFLEDHELHIAPGTVGRTRILLGAVSGTRDARSPASLAAAVMAFSDRLQPACKVFTYGVDDRGALFTSRPLVQFEVTGIAEGKSFQMISGTKRGATVVSQMTQQVTSSARYVRIPLEHGKHTVFFHASGIGVGARYAFNMTSLERRDGSAPLGSVRGILQANGGEQEVFYQHSSPVTADLYSRAATVCSDVLGG